ncbi:hypothetical protein [Cryobacterium sp. M15]|uniref:hypothetical protein n=1 Tax=Cryobacterium sp. M15 TaxID=2048291 RepID=UPI000CE35D6F|nr:hypothetical protein [Cryobacterium sp. M15]
MSDNLARVSFSIEREPYAAPARRGFRLVSAAPNRRTRPRIFYALTAVAGMAAIIVAQLLLSVGISQGAYEISSLQSSQSELGRTAASVSEDLVRVSSPQSLAANAEGLGMVSNSNPVYLRLSDGAVLGAPASASGSQAGAASLVPNSLLAGSTPLSALPEDTTGTGETLAITSAPVVPAGLAAPTTR